MAKPAVPDHAPEDRDSDFDAIEEPTQKRKVPASLRDPAMTTKIPKAEIEALLREERAAKREASGTRPAVSDEAIAAHVGEDGGSK